MHRYEEDDLDALGYLLAVLLVVAFVLSVAAFLLWAWWVI